MDIYPYLRPYLTSLPPETAHKATLKMIKWGLTHRPKAKPPEHLQSHVFGLKFPSPIGIAAGYDPNGDIINAAFQMGCGFTEIGTITPKPQEGNLPPRIFIDHDEHCIIDASGAPSAGARAVKNNITAFLNGKHRPGGIIGINIAPNHRSQDPIKDYRALITMLGPLADYICINIKPPKTSRIKGLQSSDALPDLLNTLTKFLTQSCGHYPPPLLLKLSPDLNDQQLSHILQCAADHKISGLIVTSGTSTRPQSTPQTLIRHSGNLCGAALQTLSTQMIKKIYSQTQGSIPLIASGGILSPEDAYARIRAGASLIQIYSAMTFHGPKHIDYVNNCLAEQLKRDNIQNITQAIGIDSRK